MYVIAKFIGLLVMVIFVVSIVMNIFDLSGGGDLVREIRGGNGEGEEIVNDRAYDNQPNFSPSAVVDNLTSGTTVRTDLSESDVPVSASVEGYIQGDIELIQNASIIDIKRAIAQGRAVVAHLNTQNLNNPFYSDRGDIFVTVLGYTDTHFVTQESGISSGGGFVYIIEDFMNALELAGGDVVTVKK